MSPTLADVNMKQSPRERVEAGPDRPAPTLVEMMGGVQARSLIRGVAWESPGTGRDGGLDLGKGLTAKLAVDGPDRMQCWRLVYEEYLTHGYTRPQEVECRYSLHDALPDVASFLVLDAGSPAGTVTVFGDSLLGLPADEIFHQELNLLRRLGRRPVEVGRLTIGKAHMSNRLLLTSLFDILSIHARCIGRATDLVITVNPSHVKFYEKMLLFERLGAPRDLGSVCGAPAVLMRLDLERQRQVIRWMHGEGPEPEGGPVGRTYHGYFSSRCEEEKRLNWIRRSLRRPSLAFIREYFVDRRPLIPGAAPMVRRFFRQCYPGLGVERPTQDPAMDGAVV